MTLSIDFVATMPLHTFEESRGIVNPKNSRLLSWKTMIGKFRAEYDLSCMDGT